MNTTIIRSLAIAALSAALTTSGFGADDDKMKYLVVGSDGPGFTSPQEAIAVLEKGILPTFEALFRLQADRKLLAGGLPVGERAFVFILEASSNEEADRLLRTLPAWGALKWKVTPLESFHGRAETERRILKDLKQTLK